MRSGLGHIETETTEADESDDKTPVTFEYFNADSKNGNWDNPVAKAITEATGVTLDVSYPVASQGDAKEDLSLIHI